MTRRVIALARDRAAGPVKDQLHSDRERTAKPVRELLARLAEHLFDPEGADLVPATDRDAAAEASEHLGTPLKDYCRAAQIETFRSLPETLRRDFGLEAPTGELAAAVGLPNVRTFGREGQELCHETVDRDGRSGLRRVRPDDRGGLRDA